MKSTLFCVIIFCTTFLFSQPVKNFQPDRKSLKDFNLQGKISKVETVTTYAGLDSKSSSVKIFNENGYLLYEITDADTIQSYYYDGAGNLIKKITKYDGKSNVSTFEVDEKGNLKKHCFDDFCYNYAWDKNFLVDKYEEWEFSSDGQILAAKNSMGITEYKYNNKGQIIEEQVCNEYYEWLYTNFMEYNSNNDISKNTNSSAEENYDWVTTFKYEYDKKGNWIRKTESSGGSSSTEVRTITYAKDVPAAKSKSKKK